MAIRRRASKTSSSAQPAAAKREPVSALVGALWYLRAHSILGRIKSRLKRLKQPKYLAGAVVGALYFYFVFFRRAHPPRIGEIDGAPGGAVSLDLLPLLGDIGAFILLLFLAINWLVPRQAALAFSESEIAFLFPAPVTRRMLVHYRVLGAQLGIFFTALIFTWAFGRARLYGAHPGFQLIGWWIVLALINLHYTATSFVYSRLLNRSITTNRQRIIAFSAGAAALVSLVTWSALSMRLPTAADFSGAPGVTKYLTEVLHAGPLPWLLALPKFALAPYFATGLREFALALIPALGLLAAHYWWVIHTEVAFEEATIARAEKRATRRRASEQGDFRGAVAVAKARSPAFSLSSGGPPELAFLWKNLLATSEFFRPRFILTFAVVLVVIVTWVSHQPAFTAVRVVFTVVGTVVLLLTVLLGPQFVRQDLRTDLVNADILKTYPLRGSEIVLGEILAPVAVLSVVVWLALLTVYLALPIESLARFPVGLRTEAAVMLALLAPPFIAIQVLMSNAATVLFPAWVQSTRDQTERGVEVLGQRLIFVASQLLVTALVLVPALLVGGVFFFVANVIGGLAIGAAVAAIAVVLLMAFEAWLGVLWLGKRFEALDISSELRP